MTATVPQQTSTTTDPTAPLWINDDGRVACRTHGGSYLNSAIDLRPRAKTHSTPLGTWERFTATDLAKLFAEDPSFAAILRCEDCGHQPALPATR